MMKFFNLILLGLLGIVVAYNMGFINPSSQRDQLSNNQIIATSNRLANKYNMSIIGIGGGAKEQEGIYLKSILFNRYGQPLELERAREITVDCVQEFLLDINHNEKLKPYLQTYPFTAVNLHIGILNYDLDGKAILDPYLHVMSAVEGKMVYRTLDPDNENRYKSSIYESYDEAIAILQKEKEQAL